MPANETIGARSVIRVSWGSLRFFYWTKCFCVKVEKYIVLDVAVSNSHCVRVTQPNQHPRLTETALEAWETNFCSKHSAGTYCHRTFVTLKHKRAKINKSRASLSQRSGFYWTRDRKRCLSNESLFSWSLARSQVSKYGILGWVSLFLQPSKCDCAVCMHICTWSLTRREERWYVVFISTVWIQYREFISVRGCFGQKINSVDWDEVRSSTKYKNSRIGNRRKDDAQLVWDM